MTSQKVSRAFSLFAALLTIAGSPGFPGVGLATQPLTPDLGLDKWNQPIAGAPQLNQEHVVDLGSGITVKVKVRITQVGEEKNVDERIDFWLTPVGDETLTAMEALPYSQIEVSFFDSDGEIFRQFHLFPSGGYRDIIRQYVRNDRGEPIVDYAPVERLSLKLTNFGSKTVDIPIPYDSLAP